MGNLEKYKQLFKVNFMVEEEDLPNLKYQDIPNWDSVGHMALMAGLEDAFGIEMDIDDIIDFASFEFGKTILEKYSITMQ
jgi:acyl carrier protein